MGDGADPRSLTPRERRLRRALVAVSLLAALLAVLVGLVVMYWWRYVLPTEPDPFTRGPYVVSVDETTARLRWRVEGDVPVQIVATAPGGRTVRATPDGLLRGLLPGTRHGWVAVVDGSARAWGTVTTAPTSADADVRFLTFADYGVGGEDQRAVGRVGVAQAAAFTVVPGDHSYLLAAPWLLDRNIFAPMRALLAHGPFVGTLGEHDLAWAGGREIIDAFSLPGGGDRYVFDHGPVRVISVGLQADHTDLPFLRRELARPGARRVYVLVHRPIYAGNPTLPVLRGRVTAVLAGHNHRYERRVVEGVTVLTVGTGGAPRNADERLTPRSADAIVSLAEFGLLRVDDRSTGVEMAFIDSAGVVRDRWRMP